MRSLALAPSLVLFAVAPAYAQHSAAAYPDTKIGNAADTYFGKTYKDPFRWLEDLKRPEVQSWFKAQATLTDTALDKIPARDALAKEWMELDKRQRARYSGIRFEHGRVFYKKTLGGENIGKLFYRDGWRGAEHLLFDPASYKLASAAKDEHTTIVTHIPSPDGRHVALGLSAAGAEFSELRVLDVDAKKLLPECIYPSYGPSSWTMDSKAFFYDAGKTTDIKSLEIELNRKTRLHQLGGDVATDIDFFSNEVNPELNIKPEEFANASIDEALPEYVVGTASTVQPEQRMFLAPVPKKGERPQWQVISNLADKLVRGIEVYKDHVYAVTYVGAPKYKLVRTSVAHPDWQHAETVIPESDDSIEYLLKTKSYLFLVYSNGIVGRIVKYDLRTGKTSQVKLPVSGTVDLDCADWSHNHCIVRTTSWIQPTTLWDYDADKETVVKSIFDTSVSYPGFDKLVTEEVEVPSHDGAMVPLSIIHRKDLKLDGSASAILEGYGAYGISMTPFFTVLHSIALHDNVVLAYAHPRGGSEKGEAWYRAGFKTTKPNTWKDFIACGEYLVKKGYTSAAKLAGTGTSAGGVLISRAITERPDLFGAAVCNVGCANAMRMEFSPNGPPNAPEFGTVKDPVEAAALYEMDGVQHVRTGVKYPAVLGVAGWNDPRVAPWEPGKFVAALQKASASPKPVLLKVNYDNGHFTEEKIVTFKNFAGQYTFMLWQTGNPEFQPAQ
jgi:prolyl oligopeptidase